MGQWIYRFFFLDSKFHRLTPFLADNKVHGYEHTLHAEKPLTLRVFPAPSDYDHLARF